MKVKENILSYQQEMKEAFRIQLNNRMMDKMKINYPIDKKIGLENEYFIVDKNMNPGPQAIRDLIVQKNQLFKNELGASQIELNTIPISIENGHEDILNFIKEQECIVARQLEQYQCYLLRMGFYPGKLNGIQITNNAEIYKSMLDKYKRYRKSYFECNVGKINLGNRMPELISGCQSSQLNLQVNYNDAIKLLNITYELSPLFVAISANSPIINSEYSDYLDIRNILWENGYELRTYNEFVHNVSFRTYFPCDYYRNLNEFWDDVNGQLHMKRDIDHAFVNNQKMFWRLARLKLVENKCLLETRFMSIQPTCEEDIALHLALYALLVLRLQKNEKLLPITFVKENFRRTSRYGMNTPIYVYEKDTDKIIERDIKNVLDICLYEITKYWDKKSVATGNFIADIFYEKMSQGTSAEKQIKYLQNNSIKDLIYKYSVKSI